MTNFKLRLAETGTRLFGILATSRRMQLEKKKLFHLFVETLARFRDEPRFEKRKKNILDKFTREKHGTLPFERREVKILLEISRDHLCFRRRKISRTPIKVEKGASRPE